MKLKHLFRYMKADFLKLKRTPLCAAHLAIPVVMAGAFLLYYNVSPWNDYDRIQAFFQIMGMGYPFLIGVFCAIIAEQESFAGGYQAMLSVTDRKITFSSKLLLLVLMGAFSVVFTSVMFGTGFFWGMQRQAVGYSFYWAGAGVMAYGNLFLYIFHLFLAIRFNKGVTIGAGIAGSLLSALCLTGLGDGIWICIPAAWANRMVAYMMYGYIEAGEAATDISKAVVVCGIVTAAALVAFEAWACRWDGAGGCE